MVKRLLNLAVAALFALPLASLADTATYSTYNDDDTTMANAGNYNGSNQSFTLNAGSSNWLFLKSGADIAATASSLKLDSITFYWGADTHQNSPIGTNNSDTQPDAYLILTTTSDIILGFSRVYDSKWSVSGSSTFEFDNMLVNPSVTYRAYFSTNISMWAVGDKLTRIDYARCNAKWHGASQGEAVDSSLVAAGGNSKCSLRADITVSRPWIDEAEASTETTGAWDTTPVWSDGKMAINGDNAFTPTTESPSNSTVTVTMTMCFEDVRDDVIEDPEATEGVQAAVCLATEGAATVFKAFTGAGWVVASAAGVTPSGEETYTMRFTFNYTNRTYGVEVLSGGTYVPLMNGGSAAFQLAQDKYSLSKIKFNGTGTLTSMIGDYEEATAPAEEFAKDDVLTLSDTKTVTLTADQAAWLNSIGEYATVKAWVEGTATEATFGTAYLLNLTTAGALTSFAVTDIAVADTTVTVTVKLARSGAVQSGEKDAPIKGELELHGASSLEAGGTFTKKTATIGDAKFAESDTTTLVFTKDGTTLFYKPTIVAPAE